MYKARLKAQLNQVDQNLNGTISTRLQRERESLNEEENVYRHKLDMISGFRKTDIIPIGKLHRSLDESDSESDPLSETEGTNTTSPRQMMRINQTNHIETRSPTLIPLVNTTTTTTRTTTTTTDQIRINWETGDQTQDLSVTSTEENLGIDLDAELEDLDHDQVSVQDFNQQMMYTEELDDEQIEGDSNSFI
ncbi:hypothetical protein CROQUDRAFT_670361 [Cronartium quercuum f. sp. fusiforme G11]|uniref:Uncharacterized protein n=1 Tax=Cronartium quercuum f. sp. fusiforme G11 TaxID=708437 RepID=A0A9P6NIU6_9BASI|nr:hypothetical protein CROQUDRAFT_670361 [Cronartium quercuum f. sp. fusiforme G11]